MNDMSKSTSTASIQELETPALLLEEARMQRNIARMQAQMKRLGVSFRPHVKTNKSMEVTRLLMASPTGPITVSTLKEADYFAARGVRDILYAVCIAPNKLDHALRLMRMGVRLLLILDNMETAQCLVEFARQHSTSFELLIEIDSDGHRAGLTPDAAELISIARCLQDGGIMIKGVMTHAGGSYDCASLDAVQAMAEQERAAVVHAATRLRAAGMECPVVSVGSTPTALLARHLEGVTEVRAGVFVFFDLFMAGINVCAVHDIALSVLATVIGHQAEKGWTLIDAGWMAMSRDRGTSKQAIDQGYGVVCDLDGQPIEDLILIGANQEHSIVAHRDGRLTRLSHLPVGTQVRILPNHACATAAQFPHYNVVGPDRQVRDTWSRFSGW